MNSREKEEPPYTILRLAAVLRRTGLSRATLYNQIASQQFPRQVSLGARAVGWVEGEVEDWIAERAKGRPRSRANSVSETAVDRGPSIRVNSAETNHLNGQSGDSICTEVHNRDAIANAGAPDFRQMKLLSTGLYIDRNTGTFWLRLIPEGHS